MENGEWRMENGEWRMENGEWRMENGGGWREAFFTLHPSLFFLLHSPFTCRHGIGIVGGVR
jgi:hypothetical protein